MLHHWHAAVDKRQLVRSVFVDFSKAFDHVDHNILVAKLVALSLFDVIVRWMCAFLRDRRQRVKIGDVISDWLHLTAEMPQGSYLGPLTFVILIDALRPGCLTHKYVNGTTMNEILDKSAVSSMQLFVDELVQRATETSMIVNGRQTKKILIDSDLRDPPVSVTLRGAPLSMTDTGGSLRSESISIFLVWRPFSPSHRAARRWNASRRSSYSACRSPTT